MRHGTQRHLLAPALAWAGTPEATYQARLCAGMRQEIPLPNGARVDCVSATHAIEVEFSEHWAEALGQSLLYAASTELKPGIFLICRRRQSTCIAHRLRLEEAIAAWQLPIDLWPIDEDD